MWENIYATLRFGFTEYWLKEAFSDIEHGIIYVSVKNLLKGSKPCPKSDEKLDAGGDWKDVKKWFLLSNESPIATFPIKISTSCQICKNPYNVREFSRYNYSSAAYLASSIQRWIKSSEWNIAGGLHRRGLHQKLTRNLSPRNPTQFTFLLFSATIMPGNKFRLLNGCPRERGNKKESLLAFLTANLVCRSALGRVFPRESDFPTGATVSNAVTSHQFSQCGGG